MDFDARIKLSTTCEVASRDERSVCKRKARRAVNICGSALRELIKSRVGGEESKRRSITGNESSEEGLG